MPAKIYCNRYNTSRKNVFMKQQSNLNENCYSFFADPLLPYRAIKVCQYIKRENYKSFCKASPEFVLHLFMQQLIILILNFTFVEKNDKNNNYL